MKLPVYLDNQSTTALDPKVLDAMLPYFKEHFGNASSSIHRHGWVAEEAVSIAREQVAKLIGAKPEEIYFTSGATESNNIAILGTLKELLRRGTEKPRVISAKNEHRAVIDPIEELSKAECSTIFLNPNQEGLISPDQLEDADFVSLMYGNNEVGVINDISSLSKKTSAIFHTDATQAVGKVPVSVKELGADLLSLSAHKIYGPKGIGALYIKEDLKIKPQAVTFGGGQENGIRPGTLNTPAIVGFGKACEIALELLEEESVRIKNLRDSFFEKLSSNVSGIKLNGSKERLPGNLNFSIEGVDSARLISALSSKVSISAGSACSSQSPKPSHVLASMDLTKDELKQSVRVSFGRFNSEEDSQFALEAISQEINKIRS